MKLAKFVLIVGGLFILMTLADTPAQTQNFCDNVTEIPQSECQALETFYLATNGDSWLNNEGWLTTNTPCSWFGVICATDTVFSLRLPNNNLNGNLPAALGDLSNLAILDLPFNSLTGELPAELGNLVNLSRLGLRENTLSGAIPADALNQLSVLSVLDLAHNRFTGGVPILTQLSLKTIYLQDNFLEGSIPPELGNLTFLTDLSLGDNLIGGSIPPELGNLINLRDLRLYGAVSKQVTRQNQRLSGAIPAELGALEQLEHLDIYNNFLDQNIPDELGQLENLRLVDLGKNTLTGTIPVSLVNIDNLREAYLDNNRLSGEVPLIDSQTRQGQPRNLQRFWFHSNDPDLCEPTDLAFQRTLARIPSLQRTGPCAPIPDGGEGQFDDQERTISTANTRALAVADLDGDGNLDAFVANSDGQPDVVRLGDGSSNFSETGQAIGTADSQAVSLGDVDGDADVDAVVVGLDGATVWLNDGSGLFTQTTSLTQTGGQAIALGDVDEDGDSDVVVGLEESTSIWLNDGNGTFEAGSRLESGDTTAIALEDINRDGNLDIISAGEQAGQIWLNGGDGVFTSNGETFGSTNSQAISLADLNGDGNSDIVFGSGEGEADTVWLNDGAGSFTASSQLPNEGDTNAIALGDLDRDGDIDAIFAGTEADEVWLNDGTGLFSSTEQPLNAGDSQAIALADIDNDGDLDTLIGGENPIGGDDVWLNQAADSPFRLSKTVSNLQPYPGQKVTYTVRVGYDGGSGRAMEAMVRDALPSGLTLAEPVTLTPPREGVTLAQTQADLPVLAQGLTLTNGERLTLTYHVVVSRNATVGLTMTNQATISSSTIITPQIGRVVILINRPLARYLPMLIRD